MDKLMRWIAGHKKAANIVNVLLWGVAGTNMWCGMGLSIWVAIPLDLLMMALFGICISNSGAFLLQETVKRVQQDCDPYPHLEEVQRQMDYPNSEPMKQLLTMDLATAFRNTGEYQKAYDLLTDIHIDKRADTLPVTKFVYYNNLMDICFLLGKYSEARIWHGKMMQIYSDLKNDKQKKQFLCTVVNAQAIDSFCAQDYSRVLQILDAGEAANKCQLVDNSMIYARACLMLGDRERAREHLQFVVENGNRLYCVKQAGELLEQVKGEE